MLHFTWLYPAYNTRVTLLNSGDVQKQQRPQEVVKCVAECVCCCLTACPLYRTYDGDTVYVSCSGSLYETLHFPTAAAVSAPAGWACTGTFHLRQDKLMDASNVHLLPAAKRQRWVQPASVEQVCVCITCYCAALTLYQKYTCTLSVPPPLYTAHQLLFLLHLQVYVIVQCE